MYAGAYLTKSKQGPDDNMEHMAKGICDLTKESFIPIYKLEKKLSFIRADLYDTPELLSSFPIGTEIILDFHTDYHILNIYKQGH